MSKENNNGNKLAFPRVGYNLEQARSMGGSGLTKREYFAAKMMQGVLAGLLADGTELAEDEFEIMAEASVKLADAILNELEK